MQKLNLISVLVRELLPAHRQTRGPTPIERLGVTGILGAMRQGGAINGPTAAGYLYHSAHICRTISGARVCADFGCGTGAQLLQVAILNPNVRFLGIDREAILLDEARGDAEKYGIRNVEWMIGDITSSSCLSGHSVDAIIATMALHNLESLEALESCFSVMGNALGKDGALYIEDFTRVKYSKTIDYLVRESLLTPDDAHSLLFGASLRASFTLDEIRSAALAIPRTKVFATFGLPFMAIIKTPERSISAQVAHRLSAMRDELPPIQIKKLNQLHSLLSLGGLRSNPLRG